MDALKFFAAAWVGACLRNENDRKKTIEFLNLLGNETEKTVKSLFQGGGVNHAQPIQNNQSTTDEQKFV